MPLADIAPNPAPGATIAAGANSVTFGGVSGTVQVLIGTSPGGSDLAYEAAEALPGGVAFTAPADGPVYVTALHTDGGSPVSYDWAYQVGAGEPTVGQAIRATQLLYLDSVWRRSEIATLDGLALEVPDPDGHGEDVICPLALMAEGFSIEDADLIAPFTKAQVQGTGAGKFGTGYILVHVEPTGPPQTVIPGRAPYAIEQSVWVFDIYTKRDGGDPDQATHYCGLLNRVLGFVSIPTASGGITRLRNVEPPARLPRFLGREGSWNRHRHEILMFTEYQLDSVGTQ